jgi:hypothetical protein
MKKKVFDHSVLVVFLFLFFMFSIVQQMPADAIVLEPGTDIKFPLSREPASYRICTKNGTTLNCSDITGLPEGFYGYVGDELIWNFKSDHCAHIKGIIDAIGLQGDLFIQFADASGNFMDPLFNFKLPESGCEGQGTIDTKDVEDLKTQWVRKFFADKRSSFLGRKEYVAILFDENLNPIHFSDKVGTMGNPIYVGVLRKSNDTRNIEVKFDPCPLEPEGPVIFKSDLARFAERQAGERVGAPVKFELIERSAICYSGTVTIRVIREGETGEFILRQYKRYQATIQVGTIFSKYDEIEYGLLKDEEGKTRIYNKGPLDRGPQYTLSLVLYSLPRNLESLFSRKKRFKGRDIVNDLTWKDRLGAVIGVGLKNPFNRFYTGFSFEILKGINILAVWEFAKVKELAFGLEEGDEFYGVVDETRVDPDDPDEGIPVRYKWKMFKKIVLGVSIDLRYFNLLISK